MKTTTVAILAAGMALLTPATPSFSIEGLTVSVQCPDVILGWPSTPGETFIIQGRPTLDPSTNWVTLADYYPAAWTTNWTIFVHSNQIQCPSDQPLPQSLLAANSTGPRAFSPSLVNAMLAGEAAYALTMPSMPPVRTNGVWMAWEDVFGPQPQIMMPIPSALRQRVLQAAADGTLSISATANNLGTFSDPRPLDGPQPLDGGSGGGDPPATGFYRVVRDGVHIVGMTNDMTLSGTVTFPVEVGNASGNLVSLSLTEDGTPVNGSSAQTPPFQSPLQLTADTTMMNNGVHQLSGSARWEDENGGSFEADSDPKQVNVQNEISFPDWMATFGDYDSGAGTNSLIIQAQSTHTDADWYLDFYDSQYNYIGTMGGHTDDGSIQVAWDLIGPNGESYYNDPFFIFAVTTYFNTSAGSSGNGPTPDEMGTASAVTPPIYRVTDPWLGPGAFVIAAQHAFDNILGSDDLYAEIDGFIGMAQSYGVMPPPDGEGHAFSIHFEPNPAAASDWATFRSALYHPLARNLIYFGHGGPNGLGYHQANTNLSISAAEIGARLGTMPATTNRHNFRLVILDGCNTTKGKLPEAFGIIHEQNVLGINYYNASARPSAFGAWTADKYVGILSGGVNYSHIHFIQWIQYYLALGDGIHDAVGHAAGMPDVYGVATSEFKVFGYWDLSFWAFNR